MGRRPIPIQKIEKDSNRRVTFNKRRSGLLKKAYELSILCNVDVALILFSPLGEVTCFEGPRSSIEDVITKFASSMEHERAKCQSQKLLIQGELSRKIENEEMLQEASRKLNQSRNAIVCGTKRTSHGDLHHCIQQCLTEIVDANWLVPDLHHCIQQCLTEIVDANCCLGVYEDTITTKPLSLQQVILMERYIQTQLEIIGNWKMITSCGQLPISSPQFPIFWLDPVEPILNRPEDSLLSGACVKANDLLDH